MTAAEVVADAAKTAPTGALDEFGVLDANKCLAWLLQAREFSHVHTVRP